MAVSTPWGTTETVEPGRRDRDREPARGDAREGLADLLAPELGVGDEAIDGRDRLQQGVVGQGAVDRDVRHGAGAVAERFEGVRVAPEHPEVVEQQDERGVERADHLGALVGAEDVAALEVARMKGDPRLDQAGAFVADPDVVDVVAAGEAAEDAPEDAGEAAAREVGADGDQRDATPARPTSARPA